MATPQGGEAEEEFDESKYTLDEVPNVGWDEICGLEEAKQQMVEAIEWPHKHPEIYRYYNKGIPKGVLLWGDPGCGKTMLGKAAATAVAKLYGKETDKSAFMYIKGGELLDKYVGESEKNVRDIFKRARKHHAKRGYPAIVFIDEADALLSNRNGIAGKSVMASQSMTVPTFLAEMDGLEDSGAIIILATNRPDVLDPAITRDGRIDRKIHITRPAHKDAIEIIKLNLKKIPLIDMKIAEMAAFAADEIYGDDKIYYKIHKSDDEYDYLRLRDVINGAMLANMVDFGTTLAIRRDLAAKKKTGLGKNEIIKAINHVFESNRNVNHDDEIETRVSKYRDDVISISKAA